MTVIGPIDQPTWYCMRQCREAINYLKTKRDPKYQFEIDAEKDLYNGFMDEVLGRKAA
jgi:hypothetical protein